MGMPSLGGMNANSKVSASKRPRTAATLLFLSLTVTGLTAPPGQAAPPVAASTIDYVAVGDSYSAGQGAPPYEPGCYRSPSHSYPAKVDALKGVVLKANAACSGASTLDIPAQLNYDDNALGMVTVTVGGIDAGSNQITTECPDGQMTDRCRALLTIDREEETALRTKLAGAYSAIAQKYPVATIAVLGYPRMFGGFYLWYDFPRELNASIDKLNSIISQEVAASREKPGLSRLTYVDVTGEFNGHEIGTPRPWINYNSGSVEDPANFHPNATGYKSGYYQALVNDGLLPRR